MFVQGGLSKTFKDELGYPRSQEIMYRRNICLLGMDVAQNLNVDPNQDGTPDAASPIKMRLPAYTSVNTPNKPR